MENNGSRRIGCLSCWRNLGEDSIYERLCLHFGIDVNSPYDFPRGRRPKGKSERMEGLFLLCVRRDPDGEGHVLIFVVSGDVPAAESRDADRCHYHGVAVFRGKRVSVKSLDERGSRTVEPFSGDCEWAILRRKSAGAEPLEFVVVDEVTALAGRLAAPRSISREHGPKPLSAKEKAIRCSGRAKRN